MFSFFSIEASHTDSVLEKHQYELAHRISYLLTILFVLISILYAFSQIQAQYFAISTALVSLGCNILLRRTKNFRIVFWLYSIAGTLLTLGAIFTINDATHLTDIIWVFVCVWLAYVGLGKKIGIVFLTVASIALATYIFFYSNENILAIGPRDRIDLLVIVVETLCACFAFGYLTSFFVEMQKYREEQIEQKTNEILVLNSTINANERMVGIGELTMELAHDLNSPLSSVKFGIQNIKDAVHQLFQQNLYRISENEFQEAVAYALQLSKRPIIGGIKYLKEEQLLNDKLASLSPKYNIPAPNGLLKCGITHSDHELIEWVLTSENNQALIQTLNDMVVIFQMIEMVSHAGQQSAEVISSLRNFTSHARKELPEPTNLRESLKMVMHVIVSRFKDKISIELNVPENLTISALPRDLFQIWSNVLKNSMEALEENGGGVIKVSGQKKANEIEVVIENNGPKIDEEIQEHIFDRFASSKGSLNSGFGLHIVKQIIERNGWNVNVSSEEERTAFKFTMHNICIEAAHQKD